MSLRTPKVLEFAVSLLSLTAAAGRASSARLDKLKLIPQNRRLRATKGGDRATAD